MKKKSFLVLTSGKFLEALGSGIGTCLVFFLSFLFSNIVPIDWTWNGDSKMTDLCSVVFFEIEKLHQCTEVSSLTWFWALVLREIKNTV